VVSQPAKNQYTFLSQQQFALLSTTHNILRRVQQHPEQNAQHLVSTRQNKIRVRRKRRQEVLGMQAVRPPGQELQEQGRKGRRKEKVNE